MSVYANLPLSSLETQLQKLMDEYATHTKTKNTEEMTAVAVLMKQVGDAIEAKKSERAESKPEVATLSSAEAKFNYNSMVNHIKSNIPTLQPPLDVSVFIQRLENCYNLFVKPFPSLEPYFIQQVKGQLSSDILENLIASSDQTDNFEQLKTYLKKNYGSKETPFQIMSEILESSPKDGERLQDWTCRQERRIDIVATQIIAKFNEQQKTLNKPEMDTQTAKDCFNLFGSMITYEHIRKNKPDCFKLIVKEVDTCWRPTEIGSLAATLLDRFENIDPHPAAHPSYSARPNRKQQQPTRPKYNDAKQQAFPDNSVCLRHLVYQNCPFGSKCKRQHVNPGDDEHNKIIQKLNNSCPKPSQQDQIQNTNFALPQTSIEELQPEEVGLDFFENSGLVPLDSSLYSHDS